MAPLTLWLTLLCIGIMTYTLRSSFITFFGKKEIPSFLQRTLRFVPIAVLTAIIFPALFLYNNRLYLSLGNSRLIAGILAAFVAWRTKNVLLTIAVGMAALWLLQALIK